MLSGKVTGGGKAQPGAAAAAGWCEAGLDQHEENHGVRGGGRVTA